jgi:xanthine dehydrogenase molybdenum-binding subunit
VNQVAFAIEGMLDRLAERVGLDRYEIRERNIVDAGDPFGPGQILGEGTGARACLEAVKDAFYGARVAGIACGIKNTGIGNGLKDTGRALIAVDGPDHVTVYTGFTEMGQGLMTIVRQVVCGEAGLRPEQVSVEISTRKDVECGMTTASRATFLAGEATRRAAVALAEALSRAPLSELGGQEFPGTFVCDFTQKPEEGPHTHVTFGYAAQVVILDDEGRIDRVIAAHDVGRAMNPALCEAQIEGALHQGLGFALTEDLPAHDGQLDSTRLADLRIIKAKDTPAFEIKLLEIPDPLTPYGVKGVGEIGLVPTAAAVASALWAFDGIHRHTVPMRGSAAARAMLPRKLHEEDHP